MMQAQLVVRRDRFRPFVLGCLLGASSAMVPSCDDSASDEPDPSTLPTPTPPGTADDPYAIDGVEQWYLIGDGLTPGEDVMDVTIRPPAQARYVDLWIDDLHQVRVRRVDGQWRATMDLRGVGPGSHAVLAAANGAHSAFAQVHFLRSYPLYVAVTNDWDDADNPNSSLRLQERLHENHPAMTITHFVGPYTFTDPAVPLVRAAALADWVVGMRDTYGDEIGLHIHPYCSFVDTTTVPCRTTPSFAYSSGDTTGYTVFLSAYTRDEMRTLLQRAVEIFAEHGLGRPTTFRAGGWTTEIHTMQALADEGFVAETSACNWSRLEEWEGYPGASLYDWNREHWISINETSQPYYPSVADILSSTPPVVPALEVPDNGLLVDYVTADEMIVMFHANWNGEALERSTAYVIGYHPPNFSEEYFSRIDPALAVIDQSLAANDAGPVVYTTLSKLPLAWPVP